MTLKPLGGQMKSPCSKLSWEWTFRGKPLVIDEKFEVVLAKVFRCPLGQ